MNATSIRAKLVYRCDQDPVSMSNVHDFMLHAPQDSENNDLMLWDRGCICKLVDHTLFMTCLHWLGCMMR